MPGRRCLWQELGMFGCVMLCHVASRCVVLACSPANIRRQIIHSLYWLYIDLFCLYFISWPSRFFSILFQFFTGQASRTRVALKGQFKSLKLEVGRGSLGIRLILRKDLQFLYIVFISVYVVLICPVSAKPTCNDELILCSSWLSPSTHGPFLHLFAMPLFNLIQ